MLHSPKFCRLSKKVCRPLADEYTFTVNVPPRLMKIKCASKFQSLVIPHSAQKNICANIYGLFILGI